MALQQISLRGSVGWKAQNNAADVISIQKRLNTLLRTPRVALDVDGLSGPKTEALIFDFQKNAMGNPRPDAKVDPGGATLRALNDEKMAAVWAASLTADRPAPGAPSPSSPEAGPARPLPPAVQKYQRELETVVQQANAAWWDGFLQSCSDTTTGWGLLFNGVTTLQEAQRLGRLYVQVRRWGLPVGTFVEWVRALNNPKTVEAAKEALELLANLPAASRMSAAFKAAAAVGKFVSLAKFLVEYMVYWRQGDYHMAFVEIYKTVLTDRFPAAALVDALESLFSSAAAGRGDPKKNGLFFQFLRSFNIVGIGAVAVDSVGVLIGAAVEGSMDLARFRRLMERMRASPAQLFVGMGQDLAEAVAKMADMNDSSFREMISLSSLREMVAYAMSDE